LRARLGASGRQRVNAHFTQRTFAHRVHELLAARATPLRFAGGA
jgi:hypothetical protein